MVWPWWKLGVPENPCFPVRFVMVWWWQNAILISKRGFMTHGYTPCNGSWSAGVFLCGTRLCRSWVARCEKSVSEFLVQDILYEEHTVRPNFTWHYVTSTSDVFRRCPPLKCFRPLSQAITIHLCLELSSCHLLRSTASYLPWLHLSTRFIIYDV